MYKECDFNLEGYKLICDTVYKTYNNTVAAPFIMLGATDARHYNEISDCVIRFSPMLFTSDERKGVHGLDEQISVESLKKGLVFYENLLKELSADIIICKFLLIIHKNKNFWKNFKKRLAFYESLC